MSSSHHPKTAFPYIQGAVRVPAHPAFLHADEVAMSPFKVIIVGGGPNGITAAHALHHAGIDFVVLERRQDVFEDTGASLVLSPQNLRIFHQLGILDQFLHLAAPFCIFLRALAQQVQSSGERMPSLG